MSTQQHRATAVSLPPKSGIARAFEWTNLADAYSIELPSGASTDPELLARFIFSHQAPWISSLIAVRDAIVGRVGLKAQATHVTWCSERDRPSRHRQDLQHRFDRNSPWPSGSTGMRRHWQHRARSRARDSLGDLIPLRRFARRRTSRSAWRQHGRLR
jgi:Protein of unknown function (DUF2867)